MTSQTNIIVVEINFVISLLLVTNCVCASSISAFITQPINFNLITRQNISELWFNNEVWIPSRSLGKSSDHICPCAPEITQSQGPHRKTSNRSEFLWFHYGFQYEVAKHLTLRACLVITCGDVVIMVVSRVSHKTVTHSLSCDTRYKQYLCNIINCLPCENSRYSRVCNFLTLWHISPTVMPNQELN